MPVLGSHGTGHPPFPGNTAQQRQEIEAVQEELWDYYRQLRKYQDKPLETEQQRLRARFDQILVSVTRIIMAQFGDAAVLRPSRVAPRPRHTSSPTAH